MRSLICSDKEKCYICGTYGTEEHHVFFGRKNRTNSHRYGMKVYLCVEHHRGETGVHGGNKALDLRLKREGQKAFEKEYGHDMFIKTFGRNYL